MCYSIKSVVVFCLGLLFFQSLPEKPIKNSGIPQKARKKRTSAPPFFHAGAPRSPGSVKIIRPPPGRRRAKKPVRGKGAGP